MSVFDNHLDSSRLQSDADKMILINYRISNSGNTLIPKKGSFMIPDEMRPRRMRTSKIPAGTFKEERSIFRSMYGALMENEVELVYPVFENTLRGLNLPCLIYNSKRYYQINRDVKRHIAHQIHKELGK